MSRYTIANLRKVTAGAIILAVAAGTLYSVQNQTYLDTSDPVLAGLPHPAGDTSYFASKSNVFNQLFVKRAWGWTSMLFFVTWLTSPPEKRTFGRLVNWLLVTAVWAAFTTWFFGPAVFDQIMYLTGGECVLPLPGQNGPNLLTVPIEHCSQRSIITPLTHPTLFAKSLLPPDNTFRGIPRLYKGHDVSGHIFLLTLASLFLAEQLSISLFKPSYVTKIHAASISACIALLTLWWWMILMTSVYFHNPMEKISGLVIGLAGFLFTQIPRFAEEAHNRGH